jgi:DNA polymerase-4
VGDLAQIPEGELRALFGKHGAWMARQAQGIDRQPVETERELKSASHERTFSQDVSDLDTLKKSLWKMSQGVAGRLDRYGLAAGTIAVKLRYSDFTTLGRQMSLSVPTNDPQEIYRAALALLERVWESGQPVRLLGVAGRDLAPPSGQLSLW